MSNNEKVIGHERSFLNLEGEVSLTSCVSYKVSVKTWNDELSKLKLYNYAEIDFAMSDCSKVIRLDFDINSKQGMRNSLHKLDTIIDMCNKMKEDLKLARKEVIIGQKELEKIKNAEKEKSANPSQKNK